MATKVKRYRLLNGKTPLSWALQQNGVQKEIPGKGLRFVNYFPGSTSLLVDDEVNKGRQPRPIIFEYNDFDATELEVPTNDIMLIEFLETHPRFNVDFELFSDELVAERQLAEFEKKQMALDLIKETDDYRMQATAIAVFGMNAFGWPALKARASLTEKAFNDPSVIINKFEDENYESTYLSALVFGLGLVTENNVNTAVIWNDGTEGVIISLAKGENGLLRLAEFLSVSNEESRLMHQELAARVESKHAPVRKQSSMQEIEGTPIDELSLDEASKAYKVKFHKEIPAPFRKNLKWLKGKLKE